MSDTGVSISVYVHGLGISVLINKYVNNTFVGLHIAVMCFVLCKCLLFVTGNKLFKNGLFHKANLSNISFYIY